MKPAIKQHFRCIFRRYYGYPVPQDFRLGVLFTVRLLADPKFDY